MPQTRTHMVNYLGNAAGLILNDCLPIDKIWKRLGLSQALLEILVVDCKNCLFLMQSIKPLFLYVILTGVQARSGVVCTLQCDLYKMM